ncbi:MAG TPA: CHRD domain-containing protein [Candidatus Dormibacteraeota bacterium]|nr:CHRD domain-containing protein [Candidatus Dormibacteraeota bacterium]
MSRRRVLLAILLPFALLMGLFVAPAPVLGAESGLWADLTGEEEVPPGDPGATGFAQFVIDPALGTVCYEMFWDAIDTPTAAHIHAGAAGVAGPIVVPFTAPFDSGCVDSIAEPTLQAIVDSPADYYINIHNAAYPAGAIRGQLYDEPTHLYFELDGSTEVPGPGDTDGDGRGNVDVFLDLGQICYFIETQRIPDATAAHIHTGAAGVAGPILIPLDAPVDGFSSNCIEGLDPTVLQSIVDDPAGFYVNVHTADFPAGALRGQLLTEDPPFPTTLFASLSGDEEVPGPGDPDGAGFVQIDIDIEDGYVCAYWTVTGIETATAAHIHTGAAGVAGPILVTLSTPASPPGEECTFGLDSTTLQGIADDPAAFYANVHTASYPAGAVRGQLSYDAPPLPPCGPPDICDGPMPPGDYVYDGFVRSLSFTTTEDWQGQILPDGFALSVPDGSGAIYVFSFSGNVGGGPCGEELLAIENNAESLATWIAGNAQAGAGPVTEVTIGGVDGFQVDVVGELTPECEAGIGRVILIHSGEFDSFWLVNGERVRFFLLDLEGQTIIIAVDDFTLAATNTLLARAQGVLDSMVFGGQLPDTRLPTPPSTLPIGALLVAAWLIGLTVGTLQTRRRRA